MDELRQRHAAVLIATGVYKARDIAAPGVGLAGIAAALDYLTASNRNGLGDKVADFDSGALNAKGKNVVVIGGGDTAMDCVRTAVRQGAKSVKCLYRRDRANMPGSQREVKHAEEEGVEFVWLSRAAGLPGQGPCQPRALRAHPSRHARRDRPPDAAGDPQQPRQHRGRPGAEGAGLRSRGPARRCSRRPISASPAGARSRSTGRA